MSPSKPRTGFASAQWQERLLADGQNWLIVVTRSMAPLVEPGDRVRVARATAAQLRLGDLVVFWRDDSLFVHRYLGQARDARRLECGDHALRLGSFADRELVGRVSRVAKGAAAIDLAAAPWPQLGVVLGLGSRLVLGWPGPLPFRRSIWRGAVGAALRCAGLARPDRSRLADQRAGPDIEPDSEA